KSVGGTNFVTNQSKEIMTAISPRGNERQLPLATTT
ncbi:unnamed protein product, partial [Allacma fusca]